MLENKEQLQKRIPEMMRLVERSKNAVTVSVSEDGFPNERMMFARIKDGFETHYFSTNYSSGHVQEYLMNPKASVYYYDARHYKGLTLVGEMEVLTDLESKRRLWQQGDEMYYAEGVEDPDYCVLKFTVQRGRYYYSVGAFSFTMDEFRLNSKDQSL